MGQVRQKGRPSFLRRGTPALLRLRLVAEPYAPVVPLGSAMSDVWTTFFRTSGNPGDVPPRGPSDDSAPRQSEGGPANRDDGGDDHDHRDVHGGAGGDDERVSEEPIDPWAQAAWSGGQSGDWWGHSGWAVNDRWSSYEEPRESWWEEYSWPRQDRRQSYGGTWGSTSAGSGSLQDSSAKEAEGYEGGNEAWRYRGGAALPGGWQPQKLAGDLLGAPRGGDLARGPSEKMVVPAFSGALENGSEDIGASARSYMRQIAAWRRMTRIDPSRQALTLYQHLTGKAWIDAERLDVDKLAGSDGMEYYLSWVTDRYLDVQVTQIGRSLGDFFRRLRRRQGQSVRDYMSDYDRALARLQECGCHLPDIAAAWVFVDRMALSEEQELNLLASVQNEYSLKRLQQAAIVQDRNLRKPWEPTSGGARPDRDRGGKWWGARRPQQANMANDALPEEDEQGDWLPGDDQSECVPEQVAEELYEAFMTHESAKQKYKAMSKLRGNDPEGMRQLAAERLQQAKNKSFCSGCRRRGHWHRDPECPLNQQRNGPASTRPSGPPAAPSAKDDNNPKTSYACHYVYVTWDLDQKLALPNLTAITDTACSRSVAGVPWIEKYMVEAKKIGFVPETVECKDAFKFGASRIFDSSYAVVISFGIGAHTVLLRVGVVNGDVPLLVSRPALAQLGMVMDLAENTASFRKLGVQDLTLLSTDTGHPALPVFPQTVSSAAIKSCDWRSRELLTVPKPQQYTAFMTIHSSVDPGDDGDSRVEAPPLLPGLSLASTETPEVAQDPKVFYPKKISIEAFNILTSDKLSPASFLAWWSQTPVTNDFWIEDELLLHRIHVTPRRTFFDPRGWNTTKFEQKSALLDALGSMRSSQGFACSTQRAFPEVHDQWKEPGSKSSFPLLWIGRTSFSRAARQCVRPAPLALHGLPCEPSDGSGGHQEEGTMGPPARRAFGGSEGRGLQIHNNWTVPEIRSIIQEDMKKNTPGSSNPGSSGEIYPLTKMTVPELEAALEASGMAVPAKANKGMLMRLLRDQGGLGPQTVLTFGRFRDYMYQETPISYRRWAVKEVSENDGAQEDLKMYATWAAKALEVTDGYAINSTPVPYKDSEENARVPYNPESFGGSSWDLLTTEHPEVTRSKAKAKAKARGAESAEMAQRPRALRRPAPSLASSSASQMEHEVDPEVMDEIQHLQSRLAVLQDRHGLPPSGSHQ